MTISIFNSLHLNWPHLYISKNHFVARPRPRYMTQVRTFSVSCCASYEKDSGTAVCGLLMRNSTGDYRNRTCFCLQLDISSSQTDIKKWQRHANARTPSSVSHFLRTAINKALNHCSHNSVNYSLAAGESFANESIVSHNPCRIGAQRGDGTQVPRGSGILRGPCDAVHGF